MNIFNEKSIVSSTFYNGLAVLLNTVQTDYHSLHRNTSCNLHNLEKLASVFQTETLLHPNNVNTIYALFSSHNKHLLDESHRPVMLSTGSINVIGIDIEEHIIEPYFDKDCFGNKWYEIYDRTFNVTRRTSYTKSLCHSRLCQLRVSECGCVWPFLPLFHEVAHLPLCSDLRFYNGSFHKLVSFYNACLRNVSYQNGCKGLMTFTGSFIKNGINNVKEIATHECLEECHSTVVKTKVSTLPWLLNRDVGFSNSSNLTVMSILNITVIRTIKERNNATNNEELTMLSQLLDPATGHLSMSNVKDSLIRVHIYLNSVQRTIVTSRVDYRLENFMSEIGGVLGLWMGISIISLVEILNLIRLLGKQAFLRI